MAGENEASGGRLRGLVILCASIALVAAVMGGVLSALGSNEAALAELAISLAAIIGIYFGVRLITKWRAIIVVVLVPFVFMAAVGLGHIASKNGAAAAIASLLGSGVIRSDGEDADNPFRGRNARNTDVKDLDALMEEW